MAIYDLADFIHTAIPSIANPGQVSPPTPTIPKAMCSSWWTSPFPRPTLPEVLGLNQQVVQNAATSPVNVSPLQLDNPGWVKSPGSIASTARAIRSRQSWTISSWPRPRTKYDLYIRNNRIVMYVNGQARLCNDFTTAERRP